MKEAEFDLERTKETFMEAKKSSLMPPLQEAKIDRSRKWTHPMLRTFLETCIKLLHNNKAVKGL